MNALIPNARLVLAFLCELYPVRTIGTPENPLFVASDVCRALGLLHSRGAVEALNADEKSHEYRVPSSGGPQRMWVITFQGVLRLALRSQKPAAKKFQDWYLRSSHATPEAASLSPAPLLIDDPDSIGDNADSKATEPRIFDFDGHPVRTVGTADDPLFVARDICEALDIKNPSQAVDALSPDYKAMSILDSLGGPQQTLVITEAGMWQLVMRSNKPNARRFKDWYLSRRRTAPEAAPVSLAPLLLDGPDSIGDHADSKATEPRIFDFDGHPVRTFGTAENPLFVARDVCQALDIKNPSQALASFPHPYVLHMGEYLVLREAGLYRLIFLSRKPAAERFQVWVETEVLPALRKTGSYSIHEKQTEPSPKPELPSERVELWKAFHKTRHYLNERAILQALGYAIPSASPATSTSLLRPSRSNPPQIEEWWRAVLATVKNQPHLRYHLRVVERLPDQSRLMILPGPLLTAVQMAVDSFKHYTAADIRSALQATREWVAGKHTVRMGVPGQMKLAKVWAFLVTNESNPDLQTLCTLEYPETN